MSFSGKKMAEAVLLLFILISTVIPTTVTTDPCENPNQRAPNPTLTFLDEFKDDASIAFSSGWMKITCGDSDKAQPFLEMLNGTELLTQNKQLSIRGKVGWYIYCQCSKDDQSTRSKIPVELKYAVCDEDQYRNLNSLCSGKKQLCLLTTDQKNKAVESKCQKLSNQNLCGTTVGKAKAVCLIDKVGETECNAVEEVQAGFYAGWPMVETEMKAYCKDKDNAELRDFWQGNYTLREILLINESLTFKPKDEAVCNRAAKMFCALKFKPTGTHTKAEEKNVAGGCSTGWTVSATNISNQTGKTKFHCVYETKNPMKFYWQFYLYDSRVRLKYDELKAKCVWPKWAVGWTGNETTDPVNEKCELNVTFPYPLKQAGQRFTLEYPERVIDLTTTTQPTTTQPATTTTETTEKPTTSTPTTTEITTKPSDDPEKKGKSITASTTANFTGTATSNLTKTETTTKDTGAKGASDGKMIIGILLLVIALVGMFVCAVLIIRSSRKRPMLRKEIEETQKWLDDEQKRIDDDEVWLQAYLEKIEKGTLWKEVEERHKERLAKMDEQEAKKLNRQEIKKMNLAILGAKKAAAAASQEAAGLAKGKTDLDEKTLELANMDPVSITASEDRSESVHTIRTIEQPMHPGEFLVKAKPSPMQPDDYRLWAVPPSRRPTDDSIYKLLDNPSQGRELRGRGLFIESELLLQDTRLTSKEVDKLIADRRNKKKKEIEKKESEIKTLTKILVAASILGVIFSVLLVAGIVLLVLALV